MMKKALRFVAVSVFSIALSLLAPSTGAQAAESLNHEVEGTSSSALFFGSGFDSTFSISAGYSHTLLDFLQASSRASFFITDGARSLSLRVGPTLNYAIDETGLANAFYLSALGGIATFDTSTTDARTRFAYLAEVGKRFTLVSHVAWKPAFQMSGTTGDGSDPAFALIPLQISVLF